MAVSRSPAAHSKIGGHSPATSELVSVEGKDMGDKEQLQELHDAYVWEVNGAVGEGRPDLVWQLADAYLDEALKLMTTDVPTTCGRGDCAVCQQPHPAHARARHRGWLHRTRGRLSR